jgi:outer membrane protein assembly factor BamB
MTRFAAALLVLFLVSSAVADNWPAWRGPSGQGYCEEKNIPLTWSETENVKWKVPLENQSNSTPVVWGDKIFLTQANKGGTERSLICLARADGKVLWQKTVQYAEKERNWNESWYCNASPALDGERAVVSFGSAGMVCYDFDGKEVWKRTDLGAWDHQFGNGASPVLYGDLAIMWCGVNEKGRNYLLAVNKKTGETVWEKDQDFGSWSTPLVTKVSGKDQLLLAFSKDVKGQPDEKTGFLHGFDPKNGDELWKCQGVNSYCYASPLYEDSIAVQMSGFGGSAIAVKLGGTGDITSDRLWLHPKPAQQRVGSGVIFGGNVYVVDENGIPHCYNAKTGLEQWKFDKRPTGASTWGSMVLADGRLYVLMRNGETVVFAAKPEYELLAVNKLAGAETNSSLAISNGQIFLRTFKHLYCIEGKK